MANISAAQVKELRDKTGVGMMDAKKALVAADGDMNKAVDELRERGVVKAAKKNDKVAAEGLAYIAIDGNTAAIIEVNSETDFVSENDKFKTLVKNIGDTIVKEKPLNIDDAKVLKMGEGTIQDAITNLSAVIGEKIELRRMAVLEKTDSQNFGTYTHNGGAIASLAVIDGADEETSKDVAMHVAAVNPKFTTRDEVPEKVVIHEKEVLTEETKNEGKPENIIPKIVEGRMNKFFSEVCLADQEYIKDSDMTVGKYVESKGGKLVTFERYEVGEGIEKPVEDFAEEVKNQMK